MHMVKAGVMENIYAHNNHIAEHVRHYLTEQIGRASCRERV